MEVPDIVQEAVIKTIPKKRKCKTAKMVVSGEGNGTPLQYSYLGNPMDGGAW